MDTLTISKENALKAYNESDDITKQLLSSLFGPEIFTPQKITDLVKTFEDACRQLSTTPHFSLNCDSNILSQDMKSINAYAKLTLIARVLNEGWTPDWSDQNQVKYYPYFTHKAGFGLSYDGYDGWRTYTTVGSRLCYKSSELAIYAGKQFEAIYREFLSL